MEGGASYDPEGLIGGFVPAYIDMMIYLVCVYCIT
jgi:hypothetical protein